MIPYIDPAELNPFPSVDSALKDPDGLLCAGGDLGTQRLIMAYEHGIFPWFNDDQPILWWSPSVRAVIPCDEIHVSRSTQRIINQSIFDVRCNTAFEAVMRGCTMPRNPQDPNDPNNETWINEEMIHAYTQLHILGYAQSYECWQENELVGGIYGIKVNGVFCGESMFSKVSNASKVAITHVARSGLYHTIDCQIPNPHLTSLGAKLIPRDEFIALLKP